MTDAERERLKKAIERVKLELHDPSRIGCTPSAHDAAVLDLLAFAEEQLAQPERRKP